MYVVVAKAKATPERRQELAELLATIAAASRAEAGCLDYHFTCDVEDENSFASIEMWSDRASLDAHLSAPDMAQTLAKLGPMLASAPTITGYTVVGEPDQLA